MRRIAAMFFVLLFPWVQFYPQAYSGLATIIPTVVNIQKYSYNNSDNYNQISYPYFIGRYDSLLSNKPGETYRLILKLDLSSIPDSAVIVSVNLGFSAQRGIDSIHYNYKIVSVPYYLSGSENWWKACDSALVYRSSVQTDNSTSPSFSHIVTDDTLLLTSMENALPGNQFALGLISYSESVNKAFSEVEVGSVTVQWVVPSLRVNNSFGSGWFKINGFNYIGSTTFLASVGRTITLTTDDQQYNGTPKYFTSWSKPADLGGGSSPQKTYSFIMTKHIVSL
jgi:hypothetical protein